MKVDIPLQTMNENGDIREPHSPKAMEESDDSNVTLIGEKEKQPKDSFYFVYCIMLLLGVGTLLPWNMFITAHGYFSAKLKTEKSLKHDFENYFSIAAMVPNVITFFLNTLFKHYVPLKVRMVVSVIFMNILFVLTTVMVKIDTVNWTNTFFLITIGTIVLINISSAIFQSGLFGLSGMMPPKYTQAVMAGQGVGGTFTALANIFCIMGSKSALDSGFSYFMSAVVVLFLCVFGFFMLYHIEFSKHFLKVKQPDRGTIPEEQTKRLANWDDSSWNDNSGTKSSKFISSLSINIGAGNYINPQTGKPSDVSNGLVIKTKGKSFKHSISDDECKQRPPFLLIFKKIWKVGFSVSITFFVTLAVFPSLTSRIKSVEPSDKNNKWTNDYFIPVTCFLLFNLGDLVGRIVAGFIQFPGPNGILLPLLAFLRAGFLPLFALCNAHPRDNLPVVFNSDIYFIVFMSIFGLTNGYLGSICMMYGPGLVDRKHAETAGTMMAFLLMFGLASGAAFSFVITTQI